MSIALSEQRQAWTSPFCEFVESLIDTDSKAGVLGQPVAVGCYRRERFMSEIGISSTHLFANSFMHLVRAKQTAKNGYETLNKIRVSYSWSLEKGK